MRTFIKTTCPYCNKDNAVEFILTENFQQNTYVAMDMIQCDETDGGCGSHYVYKSRITVMFNTTNHRIDWKQNLKHDGSLIPEAISDALKPFAPKEDV